MQNSNFMVKYHLLLNRENNKNQLYQNKSNILIQKKSVLSSALYQIQIMTQIFDQGHPKIQEK